MDWQAYRFLAVDLKTRAICLIDNEARTANCRAICDADQIPLALTLHKEKTKALFTARTEDHGELFVVRLPTLESYRIPINFPAPLQIAVDDELRHAYFVSSSSTLFHLDLQTLRLEAIAQPEGATCVAIAIAGEKIYTAWETDGVGILAIFDVKGSLTDEIQLAAIPTNLAVFEDALYIPYTDSTLHGEGLAAVRGNRVSYRSLLPPGAVRALRAYPCAVAFDAARRLSYVVCEDSGSIAILCADDEAPVGSIAVGRSITALHLLPDTRFALATSNMFADLSLIDLVNRKLLSVTDDSREFASFLQIL